MLAQAIIFFTKTPPNFDCYIMALKTVARPLGEIDGVLFPNLKFGSNKCHVLRLPPLAASKTAQIKWYDSCILMQE